MCVRAVISSPVDLFYEGRLIRAADRLHNILVLKNMSRSLLSRVRHWSSNAVGRSASGRGDQVAGAVDVDVDRFYNIIPEELIHSFPFFF